MNAKLTKSPWLYTAVGFVFLVVCWVCFYLILGNSFLLPSPLVVAKETLKLLGKAHFYSAFLSTLLRVFWGFLMSLVLASITVWLSKINWVFKGLFSALTAVLRALPTLAVLLIILTYSTRSDAPIIVCVITLYPLFYTAIDTAFFSVDKKIKDMCNLYKVPRKIYFIKVLLPTAMPILISQLLSGLVFAFKLVISAEILALCYNCMGGLMNEAATYDNTALLFAETVIVLLVGGIIEILSKMLVKGGSNESN